MLKSEQGITMENAVESEFKFVRGRLALLPYHPTAGAVSEDILVSIYRRLKDEGLFTTVFHEHPEMTLRDFLIHLSLPTTLVQYLGIVDQDIMVDGAGLAWLSDLTTCDGILTKGTGSFVFFKAYQSPAFTDQFASMILEYWFRELKVDTVVGLTPESNRAALVYAKRSGFKEAGKVPAFTTLDGQAVTGVITCMTKSDYEISRR